MPANSRWDFNSGFKGLKVAAHQLWYVTDVMSGLLGLRALCVCLFVCLFVCPNMADRKWCPL